MTENSKESQKAQEKKNVFSKIKETIDDKEEQLEILGTFIRLGVMVWAGFIISLNYVSFPGLSKDGGPKDITFIASVFTGCLATFSVDVGKKKKEGKDGSKPSAAIPTQILRIDIGSTAAGDRDLASRGSRVIHVHSDFQTLRFKLPDTGIYFENFEFGICVLPSTILIFYFCCD